MRPGNRRCKAGAGPDLDEDRQAVVGVSGSIQVVLVFLRDVRHDQVDQRLHGVMEGGREALVPGQLQGGDGRDGTFTHLHKISTTEKVLLQLYSEQALKTNLVQRESNRHTVDVQA